MQGFSGRRNGLESTSPDARNDTASRGGHVLAEQLVLHQVADAVELGARVDDATAARFSTDTSTAALEPPKVDAEHLGSLAQSDDVVEREARRLNPGRVPPRVAGALSPP
jgi:hypothetical protein